MAVSPKDNSEQAAEIRRIYEDAELQIFRIIAQALVGGEDTPDWAMQKLSLLSELLRKSRNITGKLNRAIPIELERLLNLAYLEGNKSAIADLEAALVQFQDNPEELPESIQMKLFPDGVPETRIDVETTMATFTGVNTEAVAALAGATTRQITDLHVPILRAAEDVYRQVVARSAGAALVGTQTRLEVSQTILNEFAEKGLKVFTDKAGRQWEIATYGEMATRAAIGQASLTGHIDQMEHMGFDLVQISDHAGECDLCRPWEGEVLSTNGGNPDYKTLDEAVSAGLFHPNCGHNANTYFEGLTEPLTKTEDPEGNVERQRQRYLERAIRQWKKRRAVALSPQEEAYTAEKVAEWEEQLEAFLEDTGRRRKREREQNIRAR